MADASLERTSTVSSTRKRMSGLLASVTNIDEARIALAGGADIIDLKDPASGALGALPLPVIQHITEQLHEHCRLSATVGDLPPDPRTLAEAARTMAGSGVDFVKVGLFGRANHRPCIRELGNQTADTRLVAVLFADQQPDFRLIETLSENGFAGVMLDTANKGAGGLREHLSHERLHEFVTLAHAANLLTGLAGSLSLDDIEPLLVLRPDYLGFRTALCRREERRGVIDARALARVRARIPRSQLSVVS